MVVFIAAEHKLFLVTKRRQSVLLNLKTTVGVISKPMANAVIFTESFITIVPHLANAFFTPFLQQQVDLGKTELHDWTVQFFDELKKRRKFAIRLGKLAEEQAHYNIRPQIVKKLCNGSIQFSDLQESDFCLQIEQKGVDMKIGLDIASMSYKKQVDQIILISGDSDFVSAAKLARREGIDFILDPLGPPIKPDLFEHIDGLRTCDKSYTVHTKK